jgi:hypothetical protein
MVLPAVRAVWRKHESVALANAYGRTKINRQALAPRLLQRSRRRVNRVRARKIDSLPAPRSRSFSNAGPRSTFHRRQRRQTGNNARRSSGVTPIEIRREHPARRAIRRPLSRRERVLLTLSRRTPSRYHFGLAHASPSPPRFGPGAHARNACCTHCCCPSTCRMSMDSV